MWSMFSIYQSVISDKLQRKTVSLLIVILHDLRHFPLDIPDALKCLPPIPPSLSIPHSRDIRGLDSPSMHIYQFLSIFMSTQRSL